MLRSSNSVRGQNQATSSIYDYKTLDEMVMRTTSADTLYQRVVAYNHEPNKYNQKLKTLLPNNTPEFSLLSSLSSISLYDVIIEGKWKFRTCDDDHLRFKLMGIDNLVYVCHDIMNKTLQVINSKQKKQEISSSCCEKWPIVNVDTFKNLTDADRAVLHRAHIFALMTIIFEAASRSVAVSQSISSRNEVSEHINNQQSSSQCDKHPKISYETAFRHLINNPDNQLLRVALHISLITSHSRMDLQQLGEKLGVTKSHFDMGSIKDSTKTFQDLIKLLRDRKLKRDREQQTVDTNKLPYKPKKKRGLNANVSGTKFAVGKLLLLSLHG